MLPVASSTRCYDCSIVYRHLNRARSESCFIGKHLDSIVHCRQGCAVEKLNIFTEEHGKRVSKLYEKKKLYIKYIYKSYVTIVYTVASELKDPICHSYECQIGSFSSEATILWMLWFNLDAAELFVAIFYLFEPGIANTISSFKWRKICILRKIDISNIELSNHLPAKFLSNLVIFLFIWNMLETVYTWHPQHKG